MAADAGPTLDGLPPTSFATAWLALVTVLLALRALATGRLVRGPAALAPPGYIPALASPPPRSQA